MASLNRHLMHAAAWAALIEGLIAGQSTAQNLAEESGVRLLTVRKILSILHRHGTVHICGWEKDSIGRMTLAVYKIGEAKDVPRPRRSRKEIADAYRARNRMKKLAGLPHWVRKDRRKENVCTE